MRNGRAPGQRAGLSHAAVLSAGRELIAEQGVAALTMRALAARLGVAPNALYSHIPNKQALIDDVLDEVLADVDVPAADIPDPSDGLHALMTSTYEVLLTHRDLVPLYIERQGARGPNAQRLGDVMSGLLDRAGVGGADARQALRVLIIYTIGFAAFASRPPFGSPTPVSAEELAENFGGGLRWLLAGITR